MVKTLAAKPEKLNLIPGIHKAERENGSYKMSSDLYTCLVTCTPIWMHVRMCAHTHKCNKSFMKVKLGMIVHTCNSGPREAQAGTSEVQGHP